MTVSERLRSCWGPLRLAQHRDLRSSPWRKPQKLHRPPFEWTTELALISFSMSWVEGHISPSKRVLWRCHSKQSSCSCEFGCRSFIEHTLWAICFQIFIWKNWRVLTRPEMGLETIFESYRSKPVLTSSETVLRQLQSRLYQAACNTVPGCFRTLIGYLWNSATDSLSHLDCVW